MGLRFRKSINLGLFRINLSKHGIGYSFGAKGLRYTKKAGGGRRITASLPGTGISYSKDMSIGRKKRSKTKNCSPKVVKRQQETVFEVSNRTALEKKFNSLKSKSRQLKVIKWLIMGATIIVYGLSMSELQTYIPEPSDAVILVGLAVLMAALSIEFCLIPHSASIDLEYDISDDVSRIAYQRMIAGLSTLMSSARVREISNDIHISRRINVNFYDGVKIERKPLIVSANVDLVLLKLEHKQLLFLPDALMVCETDIWKHIEYDKITVQYGDSSLVEQETVPHDSEVLSYTWLHANKNGDPDKRYADNYQVPVCAVGVVGIQTSNGINIMLLGSSRDKTRVCYKTLNNYCVVCMDNKYRKNNIKELEDTTVDNGVCETEFVSENEMSEQDDPES